MSRLLLVIKYEEVDTDHHLFVRGCFGEVEGKRIPLRGGFDINRPLGVGILRDREDGLYVEVDDDIPEACVTAIGIVPPEQKTE